MISNVAAIRSMKLALTAIAFAMTNTAAIAQQKDATSEIKIEATHAVTRVQHTRTGIPIETVELTGKVSYADLNLATHTGATTLEKRINDTALAVCKKIGTLAPTKPDSADEKSCVKEAVDGAMVQAKAAIAAAEKAKG